LNNQLQENEEERPSLGIDTQEGGDIDEQGPFMPPDFVEGSSAAQILSWVIDFPEWENYKEHLSKAYWQSLELGVRKERVEGELEFSFSERLRYDFSLWCGEQFAKEPDVQDFLKDLGPEEVENPYHMVFEEAVEEVSSWVLAPPFYTITSWLKKRDLDDRLMVETENFSLSNDVLSQMPKEAGEFMELRQERAKRLKSFKPLFEKISGAEEKFVPMIVSGSFHDQLDLLGAKRYGAVSERQKFKQMDQLWEGLTAKMREQFKLEKIHRALDRVNQISLELQGQIIKNKIDLEKVFSKAKEIFKGEASSHKRLYKDMQLLKNNLSIGAMKGRGGAYEPIMEKWPSPVDPEHLISLRRDSLRLDRKASSQMNILLAPGDFKGFFEYDRSCLVISIFSDDLASSYVEAMGDRFIIRETLKGDSVFIEELKEMAGEVPFRKYFISLYLKWYQVGLKDPVKGFSEEELSFFLKHIAPPSSQLFLRDEEVIRDRNRQISLLGLYKQGKLDPKHFHATAEVLHAKGLFKESLRLLLALNKVMPGRPEIGVASAMVYRKLGDTEKSDLILKKYRQENNSGYFPCLS
jgi:hypothetical protein